MLLDYILIMMLYFNMLIVSVLRNYIYVNYFLIKRKRSNKINLTNNKKKITINNKIHSEEYT